MRRFGPKPEPLSALEVTVRTYATFATESEAFSYAIHVMLEGVKFVRILANEGQFAVAFAA